MPDALSPIGTALEAAGALLLAVVLAQLSRIVMSPYPRAWARAWMWLSAGLISLLLYERISIVGFLSGYVIGEWLFLLFIWKGCRYATRGRTPPVSLLAVVFITVAVVLPLRGRTADEWMIAHHGIAAVAAVFLAIESGWVTPARQTMRVALVVLAGVHASYFPLHAQGLLSYYRLSSVLADLVLGCGMVLVATEAEQRELTRALGDLQEARAASERRLQMDPLTEAFNRHAFHAMQSGDEVSTAGSLSGMVVMIDIDGLKQINDTHGHAAGDSVIRAAANALRSHIRADDLLFRWGGDEFVAILPNLTDDVLAERLAPLRGVLHAPAGPGLAVPFSLSWGQAAFGAECALNDAIILADRRMYQSRTLREEKEP